MSYADSFSLSEEYNTTAYTEDVDGGLKEETSAGPVRRKATVAAINTKIGRIRSVPYSPTGAFSSGPASAGGSGVPTVNSPFSPVEGSEFSHAQLPIFSPTSPLVYHPLPLPVQHSTGNTAHIDECIKEYLHQQPSPGLSAASALASMDQAHQQLQQQQLQLQQQQQQHQQQLQQLYSTSNGPARYIVQHPHPQLVTGQQGAGQVTYNHHLEFFMCPEPGCGKSFLKQYNLNSHARVHSNEKPHKCKSCPLAFKRKHDLGMSFALPGQFSSATW